MTHGKLFNVLVLGGALLGLGCLEGAPPPLEDGGETTGVDASGDAAVAVDGSDVGGLTECGFCPNEACCEPNGSTRAGMVCCWGTSC